VSADAPADIAAIGAVIADIEAGFNAKDPELSVAHFAPDATAVSVDGTLIAGREALLDAHRAAYAGPLRDQYARYELADVTFVRPDVAIAHKRARATTREGEPLDVGHGMIALYVLVRKAGRWRVAARQNTVVR
jgi:uncharacterized protein (TIGR02246 family)